MLNRSNLHEYQNQAVKHIIKKEHSGLFLDMGLGKTVSTLTATTELLDDFATTKVLIVGPLRVCQTVWHTEAENWSHLKHLKFSIVTGNLKERIAALNRKADIYVINRENIPWIVDHYKSKWPFDMLVIDESSSFKNPTSKRFRALKKILKYLKYSVILTGTPSPNGYTDIWSQIYVLDQGERLGKNISMYRRTYFDSDFMGYSYKIKEGAAETIQNKIKDLVLSMSSEDYLELPEYISSVLDTPLTPKLQKLYKDFENDMIIEITDANLTAMSAATLSNKLLQFSSGAVYDEDGNVHHIHDLKFDTMDEIIEDNPNDNILVAYNYKHELDRLLKKYPQAVALDKEGKAVKDWNDGKIKMLLAHPASAGHGLNLQYGGSLLVWFGFNWSLELYQQFNKRLHRQGQKNIVRNLHIAVGQVEYRLMRSLAKKNVTQKELLESLK
ncbi:SNF2-related protein [Sulfurimonas sp.]|uniref:SNF2-related protein n=1 Tax=Sulfurimonas sp. TaxID=2022749 RepID=UPI00356988A3